MSAVEVNRKSDCTLQQCWVDILEGTATEDIKIRLAWLLQHDETLSSAVAACSSNNPQAMLTTEKQVLLLIRVLRGHASWPGIKAIAAEFQCKLGRAIKWQQLEETGKRLHHRISIGETSRKLEAELAELVHSGQCRHVARTVASQFGFTDDEFKRELDLPAVIWEALRNMPQWNGLAAFLAYFRIEMRAHLRSHRGMRRLTKDAADLQSLLREEDGELLAEMGLLEYLSRRVGYIQDLAKSRLGFSFERTNRAALDLALKRGTQTQPLEELELNLSAAPDAELQPDWVQVLMSRLAADSIVPPPPVHLVRMMLFTRIQALEDGGWNRIWEGLAQAQPEHSSKPQQWAKRFFTVASAIKRHLTQQYEWAPSDWHRAFVLWLQKD